MNAGRHVLTDDHPAIARVAWLPIAALLAAAALFAREGGFALAWPWVLGALGVAWKFRDPDRQVPPVPLGVLAPVDGWVLSVRTLEHGPLGAPALRVRVVVDPLSVYAVRAPIEGVVGDPHAPGGPRRGLWLRSDEGDEVVLLMRAPFGLGAPSATADVGDRLGQGERCGWLRLGWAADVFAPADAALRVGRGRRVRGGETVLAELHRQGGAASR
jgi:phosphatidylserine decarboxylase